MNRTARLRITSGIAASLLIICELSIQKPLSAQPHAALPSFEVASVKRAQPEGGGERQVGQGRNVSTRRFFVRASSLYFLTVSAYFGGGQCLNDDCPLVVGGPGWIRKDEFEVDALVPEAYAPFSMQQVRNGGAPYVLQMLQSLLTERFGLRFHREPHDMNALALTLAKGGPKLKPTTDTQARGGLRDSAKGVRAVNTDMADLAQGLSAMGGVPGLTGYRVLDRTGLEGKFDFTLEFGNETAEFPGPSIFTALQEQLGLKLEPIKSRVDVLVIEDAHPPSEN